MPAKGYRKPDTEKRHALIKVYATQAEKAETIEEAKNRSMTPPEFVRALLARQRGRSTPTLKAMKANAPVLRELTRVGNNLNQLVKQAHQGIVPVKCQEVAEVLTSLTGVLRQL